MDLEILREVVPMLRQQLEKAMFERNYVQLERVRILQQSYYCAGFDTKNACNRILFNNILMLREEKCMN